MIVVYNGSLKTSGRGLSLNFEAWVWGEMGTSFQVAKRKIGKSVEEETVSTLATQSVA